MQEMQEKRVQSLGWKDPLEEGMATHSSILAWRIPWTVEPGGLQSMGSQRVRHDSVTEQQQHSLFWASQVAQWVKNMPAGQETQETRVRSLGRKDSLEKYMATHSSILAWRIPWTVEPGGLQSTGLQRVGHNWSDRSDWAHMHPLFYFSLSYRDPV